MGSLNNKVAVITGGSRGLGLAIAQAYACEGAAVVIASRSIRLGRSTVLGTAPLPHKQLTTERLAQAIQIAVTDRTRQQRAAELGSKIRAENGIAQAVAVLQHLPPYQMN